MNGFVVSIETKKIPVGDGNNLQTRLKRQYGYRNKKDPRRGRKPLLSLNLGIIPFLIETKKIPVGDGNSFFVLSFQAFLFFNRNKKEPRRGRKRKIKFICFIYVL